MSEIAALVAEIQRCRACASALPHAPNPVVRLGAGSARLLIIGQAPGTKVHHTGIPWNDASGDRLRRWLGLSRTQFYDTGRVAIMPMGFCYPGKGRSGDLPPRPECAQLWHDKILQQLPAVALTLLVGQYAQARYLGSRRQPSLTATVRAWRNYQADGLLPLVHPSPRNTYWLQQNPWFETEIVPFLQHKIAALLR